MTQEYPMEEKSPEPSARPNSPKRRIALLLVVFNYAQAGISFLVNFWLARKLGATEYGVLGYGLLVGQICTVVIGFSSERTLVRDLVQSSDRNAMLSASLLLRGLMALLVVGYCVVWVVVSDSLGPKAIPVLLCSCWGALSALTSRGWLDAHYQMHTHAAVLLVEKVFYATCVVVLVNFAFEGNYAIVAASCLLGARLISLLVEWIFAFRSFRPRMHEVAENLKFLVLQNSLILGAAIANLLMTHANQLLLEREFGTGQLAAYQIAWQVILMVQLFQSQMVRLIAPRTAELTDATNQSANLRTVLLRYMSYLFAASAALLLPIVILAPWVVSKFLGEEYLAAVPILRILAGWALLFGPGLVLNQFLLGLRLQKTYFVITILAGAVALVLGQVLVPKYGAVSVAWVLLGSHCLSMVAQFALVFREVSSLEPGPKKSDSPITT